MADYITMKQVPGGTVTAKDDRIVYDANMADSGIIYGCAITYAGNNMIHIGAGYGIIKGGMFEMEDHTEYVDLAENEPTTGQIYLHLDLSADDKLTIVKETTNSLHPMVQNADANFTNGIYELQLCTFTATTTALEDVTQTFAVIQNQVLDTLPEIMANTTAGLKAGALAVKQINENLNGKLGFVDYGNPTTDIPRNHTTIQTAFEVPYDGMMVVVNGYPSANTIGLLTTRYVSGNDLITVGVSMSYSGYSNSIMLPVKKGQKFVFVTDSGRWGTNDSLLVFPFL